MQLGFYRSNYLIRMYSEKQTKICFFFFQLPPAILTPIPVQEHRALGALAPSCVSEASTQQLRLKSTPSWHHLSAPHHHFCVCWKGERGSRRAKHWEKKRSLLQRLSEGTVFTGSCILRLRMIKTETETGGSLENVHKSQSTEFITELVYSISVLRIQRYCGSHA